MTRPRLALLLLLLMAGAATLVLWLVREREIQVHLSGQVAPLPPPPAGQEPQRVEISVWFPELRLLVQADGVHPYSEGVSLARTLPGHIGQGVKYRAILQPDGHYEVNLSFRSRQLPGHCTLAFARDGFVTRRLRAIALQAGAGGLSGTASDLQPYKARRQASTD